MTTPSRLGFLRSIIPIQAYAVLKLAYSLNVIQDRFKHNFYLVPQCAALNTHLSLRRVPPQNMLADDVEEDLERPTCHPTSPLLAFWPPTTFEPILILIVFRPHLQLKHEWNLLCILKIVFVLLSGKDLTSHHCFHHHHHQLEEEE